MAKHENTDEFLEHFGVKGMRWGVRKPRGDRDEVFRKRAKEQQEVKVKTAPGRKVRAEGGKYTPPSEDAIKVARAKQTARASTTDSLSNKELQDVVTRMNLERQYGQLMGEQQSIGKKLVNQLLGNAGDQEIDALGALVDSKLPGAGTAAKNAVKVAKVLNEQPKQGKKKK